MIATTVNTNPFPGLRPFNEEETHLFFGRETQVDELIRKLGRNRFLAVIGTSGSGKSSLVNCGLFPALHRGYLTKAGSSWHIAKFRPGNNPIREMALALSKKGILFPFDKVGKLPLSSVVHTNLQRSKLGLVETYKQARLMHDHNLLVVVDQFEELFRFRGLRGESQFEKEDGAIAFVNLLMEAARQSQFPIYIVITMRSDFLGDCAMFNGLPEMINKGQYLVPRMKREERKRAIAGPIEVANGRLSDRLLMRLVNDVGDNPDQLSILQHALNRTWAAWEAADTPDQPLDLDHYQQIGTMSAALDKHAERAYKELPDERARLVCEKLFKALTDIGTESRGVRRPTKLGMLSQITEATEEELIAVIDVFRKPSRSFLMPPAGTELDKDTIIDISHESFMRIWKRLIRWTREEHESVRTYLRLSDSAMLHKAGQTSLLTDPYLQFALNWMEEEKPNEAWASRFDDHFEEVKTYLRRSRREQQLQEAERAAAAEAERKAVEEEQRKKARRAKRNTGISIAVAIIALGLSLVMLKLYTEAKESQEAAVNAQATADTLKIEILHKLGFSDSNVSKEDLPVIFLMKDIQDSLRMMESGKILVNDASLSQVYERLLDDNFAKFLSNDTIAAINNKIGAIKAYQEAQALERNETATLGQRADLWKKAARFGRATEEYQTAINQVDEYARVMASYANISNADDIRFLREKPEDVARPPVSRDTFSVGNGVRVYVWIKAEDSENRGTRLKFYADGQEMLYSQKSLSGFPTWTIQQFSAKDLEKDIEMRLFNTRNDLIGRKSITLLE